MLKLVIICKSGICIRVKLGTVVRNDDFRDAMPGKNALCVSDNILCKCSIQQDDFNKIVSGSPLSTDTDFL